MQSVLKKWLLVGSAITLSTLRVLRVFFGERGGSGKRLAVATPCRCATGGPLAGTAALTQVMGARLLVCGTGTTRGVEPAGSSFCANCLPSSVGPWTGMKPPFGSCGTVPGGTDSMDRNIHGSSES